MNVPELGKILERKEQHDAVHMALACMEAAHALTPGEHVGFVEAGNYEVVGRKAKEPFGIVDPFLKEIVPEGHWFWVLIYPNTISGLRHEWTHPQFGLQAEVRIHVPKAHIEKLAEKIGQTYRLMMAAADDYMEHGTYTYDNSQQYDMATTEDWEMFWEHYESVRGVKVRQDGHFYACSC